jgi:GntR family transcriptional regulator, transcriptional repressor for pyruvate dehydrogenase complex
MINHLLLTVADGQTLTDAVYEAVITDISEGLWPVGAKLPTEAALCERFGVSRPVIREALSRLRVDGLVQSRKGSGSYVLRQPDRDVIQQASVGSLLDLQKAFEFRTCIEQEAAYLAALRGTDEDITRIVDTYKRLEHVYLQDHLGDEIDMEFHMSVAAASHNSNFVNALKAANDIITVSMKILRTITLERPIERRKRVLEEHARVVSAVEARDPEAAREAMRHHILSGHDRLFEGREIPKSGKTGKTSDAP